MATKHGGRFHGDTVCLPVDTSTRAFRRASSAPRFPFESLDRDAVTLRDVPIQFRWPSARNGGETSQPELTKISSPPARNPPVRSHDPHRTGFGPIPDVVQKTRIPPSCVERAGLLGSHPRGTRGADLEVDDTGDFPYLPQGKGDSPIPLPTPARSISHPPPSPTPKPRFANISRFLGYFRSRRVEKCPQSRSYLQVVKSNPAPIVMVYPAQNRGAGRAGRGVGRTGGRGHVWQRTEDNRGSLGKSDGAGEDQGKIHQDDAGGPEVDGTKVQMGKDAWDRAADKVVEQDSSPLEAGEIKPDGEQQGEGKRATHLPSSSRNSGGSKDDRGEAGCRLCGLKNHRSEECKRRV